MSGKVVHFELPFDDSERASTFYRETFGWDVTSVPELNYTMVTTGPMGAQGPTEPGYIGGGMTQRQGAISAPIITLDVDDIDASLAEIEANGGSTVEARMQVGDMGWAAYFKDSEGNVLGLWQTRTS